MQNPIQPHPDRPIRLTDCILLDAWWADLKDEERSRRDTLRIVVNRSERRDRDADTSR